MKQSDFKRRIDAEIFDDDSDLDEIESEDEAEDNDEGISDELRAKKPAVMFLVVYPLLAVIAVGAFLLAKKIIVEGFGGAAVKALEDDVIDIRVENPEGEECYVTLLTKNTDDYGLQYVNDTLLHSSYGVDSDLYKKALEQRCIEQGMSQYDAGEWAKNKMESLLLPTEKPTDRRYAYEMYYEVVVAYKKEVDEHVHGTKHVSSPKAYLPYEQWKAVAEYKDRDGYLFAIQQCKPIKGEGSVLWKLKEYGLAGKFKVLIYWPKDGRVAVSEELLVRGEYKLTVKPGELVFENGVAEIP